MMGQLVISDLTVGETLAVFAGLFMEGDLSPDEYMRQVRNALPGAEPIDALIERETDWNFLNRMLGTQELGA